MVTVNLKKANVKVRMFFKSMQLGLVVEYRLESMSYVLYYTDYLLFQKEEYKLKIDSPS